MASAQFDSLAGNVLNHYHTFLLVTGSLQNQIISLGFFDRKQLFMGAVNVDDHGKFSFAHFALELFEVVMLSSTDDLFFHLKMNPLGQAF